VNCERKQRVTAHFVLYPKRNEGEFISLSLMSYGDIIDKSKTWNKSSPYLELNELSANDDLTENDIIIR